MTKCGGNLPLEDRTQLVVQGNTTMVCDGLVDGNDSETRRWKGARSLGLRQYQMHSSTLCAECAQSHYGYHSDW